MQCEAFEREAAIIGFQIGLEGLQVCDHRWLEGRFHHSLYVTVSPTGHWRAPGD
jgi:hypothetical protein